MSGNKLNEVLFKDKINRNLVEIAFLFALLFTSFNYNSFKQIEVNSNVSRYNNQYEYKIITYTENDNKLLGLQKLPEQARLYAVYLYTIDNKLEDQYNFVADNLFIKNITLNDINNDGFNDIILIYPRNDSLFISIIDHKRHEIIINDKLIFTRGNERFADDWDLGITIGGVNINYNSEPVLFFSIWAGYSILPRGIYRLNLDTWELNKFEFGAGIHELYLLNNNSEDSLIILGVASSPGNTWKLKDKPIYDDFSSWAFFLNSDLELIKSFQIDKKYSSLDLIKINENERELTFYSSILNKNYNFIKINFRGELLEEKKLDSTASYRPAKDLANEFQYYVLRKEGKILLYNNKFELVKEVENKAINEMGYVNIIGDNEGEVLIIYRDDNKFILFNKELNELKNVQRDMPSYVYSSPISYIKTNDNSYKIIENGLNSYNKIDLYINNRFYLLPLVFLIVFLISNSVFFSLKYVIEKISILSSYLANSTNRSIDSITIINNKMKILYANDSARKRFNIDYNFWFGKSGEKFFSNKEIKEIIENSFVTNQILSKEISLQSNSEFLKLKCTAIQLLVPWKIPAAVYLRIEDISKEIYSEREKVLSHSIQKVAHEIKTPLASILLNLDSIEQNEKIVDESFLKDLNTARNEIYRIRDFINKYLKFSNSQEPSFQSLTAEEIINNSLFRFTSYLEKNIKVHINGELKSKLWCDPFQLEEVFQVLIENSIDSMEGKGNIFISCKEILIKNEKYLEFEFGDEGKGIDKKVISSIYDPYTTTKKHGTGMGLAIAKKILKDHNAELKIKSTNNSGTVFTFSIKIVE